MDLKSNILFFKEIPFIDKNENAFLLNRNETLQKSLLQMFFKRILKISKNNETKKRKIFYISIFLIFNNEGKNLLKFLPYENINHADACFDFSQKSPISQYKELELILNEAYKKRKWLEMERNEANLSKKSHLIITISSYFLNILLIHFILKRDCGNTLNFVELAEANFMENKNFSAQETSHLNNDFNQLFDSIVTSYSE